MLASILVVKPSLEDVFLDMTGRDDGELAPSRACRPRRCVMLNVLRSELTRLRRPRILLTWFALMSAFAVMINMVMFSTVTSGSAPAGAVRGDLFLASAELATSHGLVVGLSSAASMFGVVPLSFWAISTATDYSTGLIRLLASAQPSRWRLLIGKVIALVMVTAAASAVATVVNVMVAPVAAQSAGVRPGDLGEQPGADCPVSIRPPVRCNVRVGRVRAGPGGGPAFVSGGDLHWDRLRAGVRVHRTNGFKRTSDLAARHDAKCVGQWRDSPR